MGPQEDFIETVVTCEGDFYDPEFHSQLHELKQGLQDLIGKETLVVKKVEPWNSVRVTFNISKEAAVRLKQLAEQGNQALRQLGVLAVQIEGDRLISLTIAGKNNETTELVLRTVAASSSAVIGGSAGGTSSSIFDLPGSDIEVPVPGHMANTQRNIKSYLGESSHSGQTLLDPIFNPPGSQPLHHIPDVKSRGIGGHLPMDRATCSLPPACFSLTSPSCSPASHGATAPSLPARALIHGRSPPTHPSIPISLPQQPISHPSLLHGPHPNQMSPLSPHQYPTPPPSVSNPSSPSLRPLPSTFGVSFPHTPQTVNNMQSRVMSSNKDITSSSPLLVNLLQSDVGGHINNLIQQQQQKGPGPLPFDGVVGFSAPPKKRRRVKKPKGENKGLGKFPGPLVPPVTVQSGNLSLQSSMGMPSSALDSTAFSQPGQHPMLPHSAGSGTVFPTAIVTAATSENSTHNAGAKSPLRSMPSQLKSPGSKQHTQHMINPYTGQLELVGNCDSSNDSISCGFSRPTAVDHHADDSSIQNALGKLQPPPNPLVDLNKIIANQAATQGHSWKPTSSPTAGVITSRTAADMGYSSVKTHNVDVSRTNISSPCSRSSIHSVSSIMLSSVTTVSRDQHVTDGTVSRVLDSTPHLHVGSSSAGTISLSSCTAHASPTTSSSLPPVIPSTRSGSMPAVSLNQAESSRTVSGSGGPISISGQYTRVGSPAYVSSAPLISANSLPYQPTSVTASSHSLYSTPNFTTPSPLAQLQGHVLGSVPLVPPLAGMAQAVSSCCSTTPATTSSFATSRTTSHVSISSNQAATTVSSSYSSSPTEAATSQTSARGSNIGVLDSMPAKTDPESSRVVTTSSNQFPTVSLSRSPCPVSLSHQQQTDLLPASHVESEVMVPTSHGSADKSALRPSSGLGASTVDDQHSFNSEHNVQSPPDVKSPKVSDVGSSAVCERKPSQTSGNLVSHLQNDICGALPTLNSMDDDGGEICSPDSAALFGNPNLSNHSNNSESECHSAPNVMSTSVSSSTIKLKNSHSLNNDTANSVTNNGASKSEESPSSGSDSGIASQIASKNEHGSGVNHDSELSSHSSDEHGSGLTTVSPEVLGRVNNSDVSPLACGIASVHDNSAASMDITKKDSIVNSDSGPQMSAERKVVVGYALTEEPLKQDVFSNDKMLESNVPHKNSWCLMDKPSTLSDHSSYANKSLLLKDHGTFEHGLISLDTNCRSENGMASSVSHTGISHHISLKQTKNAVVVDPSMPEGDTNLLPNAVNGDHQQDHDDNSPVVEFHSKHNDGYFLAKGKCAKPNSVELIGSLTHVMGGHLQNSNVGAAKELDRVESCDSGLESSPTLHSDKDSPMENAGLVESPTPTSATEVASVSVDISHQPGRPLETNVSLPDATEPENPHLSPQPMTSSCDLTSQPPPPPLISSDHQIELPQQPLTSNLLPSKAQKSLREGNATGRLVIKPSKDPDPYLNPSPDGSIEDCVMAESHQSEQVLVEDGAGPDKVNLTSTAQLLTSLPAQLLCDEQENTVSPSETKDGYASSDVEKTDYSSSEVPIQDVATSGLHSGGTSETEVRGEIENGTVSTSTCSDADNGNHLIDEEQPSLQSLPVDVCSNSPRVSSLSAAEQAEDKVNSSTQEQTCPSSETESRTVEIEQPGKLAMESGILTISEATPDCVMKDTVSLPTHVPNNTSGCDSPSMTPALINHIGDSVGSAESQAFQDSLQVVLPEVSAVVDEAVPDPLEAEDLSCPNTAGPEPTNLVQDSPAASLTESINALPAQPTAIAEVSVRSTPTGITKVYAVRKSSTVVNNVAEIGGNNKTDRLTSTPGRNNHIITTVKPSVSKNSHFSKYFPSSVTAQQDDIPMNGPSKLLHRLPEGDLVNAVSNQTEGAEVVYRVNCLDSARLGTSISIRDVTKNPPQRCSVEQVDRIVMKGVSKSCQNEGSVDLKLDSISNHTGEEDEVYQVNNAHLLSPQPAQQECCEDVAGGEDDCGMKGVSIMKPLKDRESEVQDVEIVTTPDMKKVKTSNSSCDRQSQVIMAQPAVGMVPSSSSHAQKPDWLMQETERSLGVVSKKGPLNECDAADVAMLPSLTAATRGLPLHLPRPRPVKNSVVGKTHTITVTSAIELTSRSDKIHLSHFVQKSLNTPTLVSSSHAIMAPGFTDNLTESVQKVMMSLPNMDTTPPSSPNYTRVSEPAMQTISSSIKNSHFHQVIKVVSGVGDCVNPDLMKSPLLPSKPPHVEENATSLLSINTNNERSTHLENISPSSTDSFVSEHSYSARMPGVSPIKTSPTFALTFPGAKSRVVKPDADISRSTSTNVHITKKLFVEASHMTLPDLKRKHSFGEGLPLDELPSVHKSRSSTSDSTCSQSIYSPLPNSHNSLSPQLTNAKDASLATSSIGAESQLVHLNSYPATTSSLQQPTRQSRRDSESSADSAITLLSSENKQPRSSRAGSSERCESPAISERMATRSSGRRRLSPGPGPSEQTQGEDQSMPTRASKRRLTQTAEEMESLEVSTNMTPSDSDDAIGDNCFGLSSKDVGSTEAPVNSELTPADHDGLTKSCNIKRILVKSDGHRVVSSVRNSLKNSKVDVKALPMSGEDSVEEESGLAEQRLPVTSSPEPDHAINAKRYIRACRTAKVESMGDSILTQASSKRRKTSRENRP